MKNPHDWRFQFVAEGHPEPLLRLLGLLAPGASVRVTVLPRELQVDPVVVDTIYRIGEGAEERIVHFEAVSAWKPERIPILALYLFLIRQKYKIPVSSYIVLMSEKAAPKILPPKLVYEDDGFRVEAPYQVFRLWERDPAIVFEPENKILLPWVPILKGGAVEFERAVAEIEWFFDHPAEAPHPPEQMAMQQLAASAVVRYDQGATAQFLERLTKK